MANFLLAREAYTDLEDIERYTLETWGDEQRVTYLAGLFDQIEAIANDPKIGRARPEIDDGVHSLPYERHVIFYEIHLDRCHVLRILHAARDVRRALP